MLLLLWSIRSVALVSHNYSVIIVAAVLGRRSCSAITSAIIIIVIVIVIVTITIVALLGIIGRPSTSSATALVVAAASSFSIRRMELRRDYSISIAIIFISTGLVF